MTRFMTLVLCVLTCMLLCVPVCADDPPKKLTAEERKELTAKWEKLVIASFEAHQAGRYSDAAKGLQEAVEVARRLYPKTEFPAGHKNLAGSLVALAMVHKLQKNYADAEPLLKSALEMYLRLTKGDDPDTATTLNNLAMLSDEWGKYAAAEPPYKDALEMRRRLYTGDHPYVANSAFNLACLYHKMGKYTAAESLYKDALGMRKRLYKGDHPEVGAGLNNLAWLYHDQGRLSEAEPLYKDALAMAKRLNKGDHPDTATVLNNLAEVYRTQGKWSEAEPLSKEALAMCERLFKGDHPDVARGLNNLAALYKYQDKPTEAEPLLKTALAMNKRLYDGDHPNTATSLSNLAQLYRDQGKYADAKLLFEAALAMSKRLFKGDHPHVALDLNNLAMLYKDQGKYAAAELLFKEALAMSKRVFKSDHSHLVLILSNAAILDWAQGKDADAQVKALDALNMSRRLIVTYAKQKSEGEALTFLAMQPLPRDFLFSLVRPRALARATTDEPASAYSAVWATKGTIARVFEQRQLQARAAATDLGLAKTLSELSGARRRRAELLLAPMTNDPLTIQQHDAELKAIDEAIGKLTDVLTKQLPAVARADKLNDATLADFQKALPTDVAVVDYYRYVVFQAGNPPAEERSQRTERYVAFVVTREKVAWVDLDTATKIEPVVTAWREAITGGKEIPATTSTKARELLWDKVRKELPARIKTVYICPDQAVCKVPFAALPGDKPGTILLEDFAIATIPHAPFLLDKLWPQDPQKNPPANALVVGGVKYDAELTAPAPNPNTAVSRGDPLVKPGEKLGWSFLNNTVGEANGVGTAAAQKKLAVTRFDGDKATSTAILAALPKARYAHFATHGFFADPYFRGVFQLDEKDYEKMAWGERRGRAINSPLVMTGLVFAGANNPKTPGRGILTGEQLIDLDLSGLELAVLSACETGLGDVAGGEGAFGLQRAFHYAGTKNVVCSLWKVPDESTAALMHLFYQNLWDKNLTPMESLRQAQLEIYKNPQKIPELAKGFRGKFEVVPGMGGEGEIKPGKDGKAHPLLWAAFTLSGPGR